MRNTACTAQTVAQAYDNCCDQWDAYRGAKPVNRCVEAFASLLEPGSRVLDVGCGAGRPIASYLVDQGFHVTGIDISERMIAKARALGLRNADFQVADVLEYRPPAPFDAVIAFDSLWHVDWSSQAALYGHLASFLRDGGYLMFTHGKHNGTVTGEMFGERFYYSALDTAEVRGLLTRSGFAILDATEDYREPTTGDRELIVTARKTSA